MSRSQVQPPPRRFKPVKSSIKRYDQKLHDVFQVACSYWTSLPSMLEKQLSIGVEMRLRDVLRSVGAGRNCVELLNMLNVGGWMEEIKADPWYNRFSVDEAKATFQSAGFIQVPKENFVWGDTLPGTNWPRVCFERNGVSVVAYRLSYDVYAPGDGSLMACLPEAQLAIRFVRAFEQEAELMATNRFSDEQFNRVQLLGKKVYEEFVQELEETLKRLREW